MLRAHMTVILTSGERYSANHVAVVRRAGSFDSDITFVCSGQQISKPAEDVERIEYRAGGAMHCNACDQRIDTPSDYPRAPEHAS